MRKRNLLTDPCWRPEDLGQALPNSPHAVSVALPRWKDVIAYEEKDPECINSLQSIYPRFGLNPLVAKIAKKGLESSDLKEGSCWPYPDHKTAIEAKLYCNKVNNDESVFISDVLGLKCLIASKKNTQAAKSFWQHTGLGASSRLAAIALKEERAPSDEQSTFARKSLKARLGDLYECESSLVHLYPSGMAALTAALKCIYQFSGNSSVLQLGFPYVDVLKLPQKIFEGSDLLLDPDLKSLEQEIKRKKPGAIIVELPSNPMLRCVDLPKISKIAHKLNVIIIADDTIGSAINIDPLPYVDIVFSSLTKSFAGRGDILAGSLVISPTSRWRNDLNQMVKAVSLANLSNPDTIALEDASKDIKDRLHRLNNACLKLKTSLQSHPRIARVLHPADCLNFKGLMRSRGGYGCLLSFELLGGLSETRRFYDKLKVCKGPSLGTNFTLVCPYVLLAHYDELEWAKECGVPAHLIRVSVGLEDSEELWGRFNEALKI